MPRNIVIKKKKNIATHDFAIYNANCPDTKQKVKIKEKAYHGEQPNPIM